MAIVKATNSIHGTKITTEDGTPIKGVRNATIRMAYDRTPLLTLEIVSASVDVEGTARFTVKHPLTGQLKQVEQILFADGSQWIASALDTTPPVKPNVKTGYTDVTSVGEFTRQYIPGKS